MKNMVRLAGYRKIFDLITAWTEEDAPHIYVTFVINGNKLGIMLETTGPIDTVAADKIEELFLADCPLVDSDIDMRIYELGEIDVKLDTNTIELLEYATDRGFVLGEYTRNRIDNELLIKFIIDNPEYTISVERKWRDVESEVIIA